MKYVGFKNPHRRTFKMGVSSWMCMFLLLSTAGLLWGCAQQPDASIPTSSSPSSAPVAEQSAPETAYPKDAMESLYLSCSEGCNSLEMPEAKFGCLQACQCVKEKVPAEVPYEDFMAYGQAIRENKPPIGEVDQHIRKIADGCFEQSMFRENQ